MESSAAMTMRWIWSAPPAGVAVVCLLGLANCESSELTKPNIDAGPLAPAFASAVVAYNEGSGEQNCGDMMPLCDEQGTCGPVQLLGAPDEMFATLPVDGTVEVAFLCSSLVERGVDASAELKIWTTVPDGGSAIVQVSVDGATFDELGVLAPATIEFDLARLELTDARFVRVLNTGSAPIELDAFEALRNP